jgi:protein gp37
MKFWDRAWSLVEGCTPVSEGCDHCWLAAMQTRFQHEWKDGTPVTENGVFTGHIYFRDDRINLPLKVKKPTVWAIWSDLFHEQVKDQRINKAFAVMAEASRHTFLVITKRPERAATLQGWPANVYCLVTCENQVHANERIPWALRISGKVGLLIEPMLGNIQLSYALTICDCDEVQSFHGDPRILCTNFVPKIKVVILGGETGPKARAISVDWVRSVRDKCRMAKIPFFLKHINKQHGRILDDQKHNELPWELQKLERG